LTGREVQVDEEWGEEPIEGEEGVEEQVASGLRPETAAVMREEPKDSLQFHPKVGHSPSYSESSS
jgi:hypothetical protein